MKTLTTQKAIEIAKSFGLEVEVQECLKSMSPIEALKEWDLPTDMEVATGEVELQVSIKIKNTERGRKVLEDTTPINPETVVVAWKGVCIQALQARMDACVDMVVRNKERILVADECQIIFKKKSGKIHAFNHQSFNAMKDTIERLKKSEWDTNDTIAISQLLKALYWVPMENRTDHKGFGFGELISCLEESLVWELCKQSIL